MDFDTWNPVYEAILQDFGFDRAADERARDVLAGVLDDRYDASDLDVAGKTVAIAGAGPSLSANLGLARDADAVFAASNAATVLREAGVPVDCMVTDVDKSPATAQALTGEGTPVAVHAHGDNVPELREHVPRFDHAFVLPTTQAEPTAVVANYGGFTDGDRAAFLADALGAGRLTFPGWDFDDPAVGPMKRRKLRWAARLLLWLERRRGERFGVLDGRRDAIDDAALP
ncbi:DUF115 domain-containing protein [Haloarculaceae archaeon H-GB1-1]|nr:DUF115 domain-containing protein [Haloarculaceae archaeon H-GB1-1]